MKGARAEAERPVRKPLQQTRRKMMGAWKVVTVKVVRRDRILDIFWKQGRQDLLMGWIWRVREREESRVTPRLLAWATGKMQFTSPGRERKEME